MGDDSDDGVEVKDKRRRKHESSSSSSSPRDRSERNRKSSSSSSSSKLDKYDRKQKKSKKKSKKKKKKASKKDRKGSSSKSRKRKRGDSEGSSGDSSDSESGSSSAAHSGEDFDKNGEKSLYRRKLEEEQRSQQLVSLLGYTNEDNPFGDPNLSQKFEWGAKSKQARLAKKGGGGGNQSKARGFEERVQELGAVRQRREEREIERENLAKERAEEARRREMETFGDIYNKEEEADRNNDKLRSRLRLRDNRATLVDEMYRNILLLEDKRDDERMARGKPQEIQDSLRLGKVDTKGSSTTPGLSPELRPADFLLRGYGFAELHKVSKTVQSLMARDLDTAFWKPIAEFIDATAAKQRWLSNGDRSTADQVETLISGKSLDELRGMRSQVQRDRLTSINGSAGGGKEESYWNFVLMNIATKLASEDIRKSHARLLGQLGIDVDLDKLEGELLEQVSAKAMEQKMHQAAAYESVQLANAPREAKILDDQELGITAFVSSVSAAATSSVQMSSAGSAAKVQQIDQLDDQVWRKRMRQMVIEREQERNAELLYLDPADRMSLSEFHKKANAETQAATREDDPEEEFQEGDAEHVMSAADEIKLPTQVLHWHARYKPRQPKHYNKVLVGYDWNKYNRTHYDRDNPPPKSVRGYQFTLFYPDLIDKQVAPTYSVEPAQSPEFAILRFHAGPPYSDVAFQIVNREWRKGKRTGFKFLFSRGKLQLNFSIKRFFYRR